MVGILTFHRGPNHGGYLQALELCRAVLKLGHEVEIIDYQNPSHEATERFKPWVYRRPSSLMFGAAKHLAFRRARKELNLSPRWDRKEEIDWNRYTTILVGADVVWDYREPLLGGEDVYFGGFRDRFSGKLAAYAPSCGVAKDGDPVPDYVTKGLPGFDFVAVRDEATRALFRKASGKDCDIVLDPTWLPFGEPASEPVSEKITRDPYVAVYGFKIDPANAEALRTFARSRGLKILASGYQQKWADRNLPSLTPLEWVSFLREARYAFAGTFHGSLYAMSLGKQFAVLSNDRIAQKLSTSLSLLELEGHLLKDPGDLTAVMDSVRDSEVEKIRLKEVQERSWNYLKMVLEA